MNIPFKLIDKSALDFRNQCFLVALTVVMIVPGNIDVDFFGAIFSRLPGSGPARGGCSRLST